MGSYTVLTTLGTKRWQTRAYKRRELAPHTDDVPIEETRFSCPECRQYFPYEGSCDRCERPLVDRTVALPASPAVRRPRWMVSGSPEMVLLGMSALLGPAVFFGAAWDPGVMYPIGGAFAVVLSLLAVGSIASTTLDRRDRRRDRERARARALAQPCIPTSQLSSADAPELVRVAGRLRFDVDRTTVRVRVCDESGSALLPDHPLVQAYRAGGTHEELDSIRDGDEVEILAACHRVTEAGDGYRQAKSHLEISAETPMLVWVRNR